MTVDRERFPDRRPSVTKKIEHAFLSGKSVSFLVTFGFYSYDDKRVRELFCADFKEGADLHSLIIDTSIVVSRLLQTGQTPKMILASLGDPRSIIGTVIQAAADLDEEINR